MPAPLLRHYSANLTSTSVITLVTVPTGRALVISKLLATTNASATPTSSFTCTIGGQPVANGIAMNAGGQVYTETGLVALAGELVNVSANTANVFYVHLFGEEVDNV